MADNYIKYEKTGVLPSFRAAKLIRVLTVPPIMVSVMFLIFYFNGGIFSDFSQLLYSLIFFAIIPILAYPICLSVPALRKKGREGERNLAFVLNLSGYTVAIAYAFFAGIGKELMLIYLSYFYSVVLLSVVNKLIKKRASGHACAMAGPLIFLVYFEGAAFSIPCVCVFALIVWASLKLKRHTPEELFLGSFCALFSFSLAFLSILL